MIFKRLFASLVFLLCSGLASAATLPDSGWWWNSSEGGRGYSIEIQDNQIFFASYTYDPSGSGVPIWYYSSGTLTGDSIYSGRVIKATGGACFGCTQKTPSSTDVGAITIVFNSNTTATLTILGTTHQITRFDFTANNDNVLIPTNDLVPNACFGEWTVTIGNTSTGVYSGDRIQFYSLETSSSDGSKYLGGARRGNANAIAVCLFDPFSKNWGALVKSSDTYYEYFQFKFIGVNLIEGLSWTYPIGGSASGAGLAFVGFRTGSKSFIQGHGGPTTSKSVSINGTAEKNAAIAQRAALDKMAASQTADRSPASPATINMATKLTKALNSLR